LIANTNRTTFISWNKQKPELCLMKNSYPASLITVASAITEACLHAKKQLGLGNRKKSRVSRFLKLNDKETDLKSGVGIKFDNISARKYFVLLQSTQASSALKRTTEKVV
jgi:hypothetical protein